MGGVRLAGARRGQSTVELALALPLLLLIVLGIVDFGRVFVAANVVSHATQGAARYGSLNATDISGIRNRVIDEGARSSVTVTTSDVDVIYLDSQGQVTACALGPSTTITAADGSPDCPYPCPTASTPPPPPCPTTVLPGDMVQVTTHIPWAAETTLIQGVMPTNFQVKNTAAGVVEQ